MRKIIPLVVTFVILIGCSGFPVQAAAPEQILFFDGDVSTAVGDGWSLPGSTERVDDPTGGSRYHTTAAQTLTYDIAGKNAAKLPIGVLGRFNLSFTLNNQSGALQARTFWTLEDGTIDATQVNIVDIYGGSSAHYWNGTSTTAISGGATTAGTDYDFRIEVDPAAGNVKIYLESGMLGGNLKTEMLLNTLNLDNGILPGKKAAGIHKIAFYSAKADSYLDDITVTAPVVPTLLTCTENSGGYLPVGTTTLSVDNLGQYMAAEAAVKIEKKAAGAGTFVELSSGTDYSVAYGKKIQRSAADFAVAAPVVTLNSAAQDGDAFKVTVTGNDALGRPVNSATAEMTAGAPKNGDTTIASPITAGGSVLTVSGSEILGIKGGTEAMAVLDAVSPNGTNAVKALADCYGNAITPTDSQKGALYDGDQLIITAESGAKAVYTFRDPDLFAYDFTNATGGKVYNTATRNQTNTVFPKADGSSVYPFKTIYPHEDTDGSKAYVSSEQAPGKEPGDRALVWALNSFDGEAASKSSQIVRVFPDVADNTKNLYAVNASLRTPETPEADVDYYFKMKSGDNNSNASNYLPNLIIFRGSDRAILTSTGVGDEKKVVGYYEPGNWYNVGIVLKDTASEKKVRIYLNGVEIGAFPFEYGTLAELAGQHTIYFNQTLAGGLTGLTEKAYLDNIKIYELADENAAPNGYDFPLSVSGDYQVSDASATILIPDGATAAELLSKTDARGMTVGVYRADETTVVNGALQTGDRLILKKGGFVKSYALQGALSLWNGNARAAEVTAGKNAVIADPNAAGVMIAGLYDSGRLIEVKTVDLAADGKEAAFHVSNAANKTIRAFIVNSVDDMLPLTKNKEW